jgi:nucleoside-diphosphate-sugar epimerase
VAQAKGENMTDTAHRHILILGCGFVGTAFGVAMQGKGAQVSATCRSRARAEALAGFGFAPIVFDGTATAELSDATRAADVILASIPPHDQGDPAYLACQDALSAAVTRWIGYLSTTGVYGDRAGGWAFEDDAPSPLSVEAKRRVLAEQQWRSLPHAAHVFRLPGIYGPGRSALDQVRAGTARRIDKPGQVFSRAHREDIVSALMASLARPNHGRIYNVCDDLPCDSGRPIAFACQLLGVPPPPLTPFEDAGLSDMGRRFYSECKRVSNARIKSELGWRPHFPTYVEGLTAVREAEFSSATGPKSG